MPTMTWVELLSGSGPPDALSSVAVMLRTYWGPLSLGGGLLLSLMMPAHTQQPVKVGRLWVLGGEEVVRVEGNLVDC